MSTNWTFSSTIFAELDVKNFQGDSGLGFYRLIAKVSITTHGRKPEEAVDVSNIGGELWVRGKDANCYLGYMKHMKAYDPVKTRELTNSREIQLEIELDSSRIEAIEKIRHGGELIFTLEIQGAATCEQGMDTQSVTGQLQYRANQSTWIEILELMRYKRTLLLEVPVMSNEISTHFPKAVKHLETAQTQLLKGHFREAVGACRDVLESLTKALGDKTNQTKNKIKDAVDNQSQLSKEERLRLVRWALITLTHPARHADKVAEKMEWGPEDARAIIMITTAILQTVAIKNKPA